MCIYIYIYTQILLYKPYMCVIIYKHMCYNQCIQGGLVSRTVRCCLALWGLGLCAVGFRFQGVGY